MPGKIKLVSDGGREWEKENQTGRETAQPTKNKIKLVSDGSRNWENTGTRNTPVVTEERKKEAENLYQKYVQQAQEKKQEQEKEKTETENEFLGEIESYYNNADFKEKSAATQLEKADQRYDYINDINGARQKEMLRMSMGGATSPYRRYDAMTESEIQLYNYLYATEGKETAEKYLDSMADTFAIRVAQENAPESTAAQILSGFPAGVQQFTSGISQLFSKEPAPMEMGTALGQVNREKLAGKGPKILGSSLGQMAYDAVQSGSNMLVPMLAGTALGGKVSTVLLGASAGGNAYREKMQEGWEPDKAMTYGAITGALEGGLQYILGGISSLGGTSKWISQKVAGMQNAAAKFALQFGGSVASEGLEEGLQEALAPVVEAIITKEDLEPAAAEDIMYSALLGALTAGVIEAPGLVTGRKSGGNSQVQESTDQQKGTAQETEDVKQDGLTLTMPEELVQPGDWQMRETGADNTTKSTEGTGSRQSAPVSENSIPQSNTESNKSTYEGRDDTGLVMTMPEELVQENDWIVQQENNGSIVKQLKTAIPQMETTNPVAVVTGNELPRSGKIVERITEFVKQIGNQVNRPGFGNVIFSKGRIKNSMVGHGTGNAKIETFAAVPAVIEKGIQIGHEKNWKGRGYDTYLFAAPVEYRGKKDYLGVLVTKDAKDGRYYLHEVVDSDGNLIFTEKENTGAASDGRAALSGTFDTVTAPVFETSIQQEAEDVNPDGLTLTMPEELRQESDWIVQQEKQTAAEDQNSSGMQTEFAETARRLGQALGRDIQVYNGLEETGAAERADGYYSNGKLHINSRSIDPAAQVIGHELTHSLEDTGAYRDLERLVKQRIQETGGDIAKLREEKQALYARNGVQLENTADIDHEIVAEYVAKNLLYDEKSIMEVVSRDKSLGRRILDFINSVLAKLGNSSAKEKVFLTRARDAYANALAEADSEQKAQRSITEDLQNLRDDYAQGRITDEQFDEAMQDIMEQESLAGRSMLEDDWSGTVDGDQYSISESYQRDLDTWERDGRPDGEVFILGATGDVMQGLGAMEQDIYLRSEKVNTILREHPEMTMEEIRKIPEILDDPVLVLKSRNVGRSGYENSRMVIFGTVKARDGRPVLVALDLMPTEGRLRIENMQKVTSAYTKDTDPVGFLMRSEVLYADKKRTAALLRRVGFQMPTGLLRSGSMGSITYGSNSVNLEGVPFDQVVETQERGRQYSINEAVEGKTIPDSIVDALPAKAKLYLEKVENAVSRDIRKRWNLNGNESIAPVGNAVRKLSEEYLKNGEISQEAMDRIFDEAYEASGAADNAPELQREDFRMWARHDFDMAAADLPGELKNISRYAQERQQKEAGTAAARAYTTDEIAKLWQDMKAARRNYERVNARNLLTEHDQTQVRRLLKGDIELQHLKPGEDNIKGITNVYNAKLEYEKLSQILREWNQAQKAQRRQRADTFLETANEWKDKPMGILYSRETMERNIRDIVKDKTLADAIIKEYFEPVHRAAADSNRLKNQLRDRVRELDLSRKVEKGNQVSEAYAVQLLGEAEDNIRVLENSQGRIKVRDGKTLEDWQGVLNDLWKENPNLDQEKIRNAVKEFRSIYDQLFEQMNETRIRNGYEPVNYRQGYFPHFQSIDGDGILAQFGRALGIETKVTALPTTINGLTHTFKPGIQWFGNALERKGYQTTYDALEGFDRYIEGVADVIYQTDNIQNLRALASQARYRTGDEGIRNQIDEIRAKKDLSEEDKKNRIDKLYQEGRFALSNFVVELDEYTNLLANKKSLADRTMEQKMGRQMYNLVKGLESRVAANMVAVNPGSWLTNFIPLTQGVATVDGKHMLKGMWDTLRAYQADDGFVDASTFLTNRRGSDPIVKTWAQKASAAASKPMEYIDQFTADSLVRARYSQNIERGLSEAEAMGDADAWASSIMADRSKGATPTLFNQSNPMTKLLTQFQLEVNNQLSYLYKDMPKDVKERGGAALAAALIKFALGAFLYNELYEYLIGRRPALDPINMLNEAAGDLTGYEIPNLVETGVGAIKGESPDFQTEKTGVYGAVSGLLGEAAEQTPFIGGLLGGGRIPISSALPDVENLGKAALYDKWSGEKRLSTAAKELAKPLLYLAPPFGGGQAKKVAEGIKAAAEGGSYSINSDGEKLLQYPVYSDTPGDAARSIIQSSIFGKTSLPEAKEWINSEFDSYSAKETDQYLTLTDAGAPQREVIGYIDDTQGMKNLQKMRELSEAPWDESIKELGMGYILSEKAMERYMAARDAGVGTLDYTEFLENAYANAQKRTEKDTASPSQEDVKNALNDTNLSRSQKRAIWKSYGWKTDSPW